MFDCCLGWRVGRGGGPGPTSNVRLSQFLDNFFWWCLVVVVVVSLVLDSLIRATQFSL